MGQAFQHATTAILRHLRLDGGLVRSTSRLYNMRMIITPDPPFAETVHAVAVAVGEHGVLIRGASGAGKSALAAQMIATWSNPAVCLIADDRVLLAQIGGRIVARPHLRITGKIELRGYGIVSMASLDAVVLRLIVDLEPKLPPRLPEMADLSADLLGKRLPRIVLQGQPQASAAHACSTMRALWTHIRNDLLSN
jgi:HPr kinase/phosphorylase